MPHALIRLALLASIAFAMMPAAAYAPDTTFSGDGKQTIPFDLDTFKSDEPFEILPAPGGGYFVAGYATISTQSGVAIAIGKLTATGALDTTWGGGDGKVDIETLLTGIVDVAIDSQGRLVFVGTMAESPGPGSDIAVMRVLPNGNIDGLFGLFGIIAADIYDQDRPIAVTLTPADHIVIQRAGHQNGDTVWIPGITAFENDGTSSSNLLIAVSHADAEAPSGAIEWSAQRGRAIMALEGINVGECVVRVQAINVIVNGAGSIAASNSGIGVYSVPGVAGSCGARVAVKALTTATNGAIYVGGHVALLADPDSGRQQAWAMKISPANALDTSFDGDGVSYQLAPFPLANLRFTTFALDAAGRLLAGGNISDESDTAISFAVERFTTAGVADTTFAGGTAILTASFAGSGGGSTRNLGRSLLVDNGRILLAGSRLWAAPVDFDFAVAAWSEPSSAPHIFANGFE